jgi:ATP-dependent exoDNAse (exonuclease V) beta subunit
MKLKRLNFHERDEYIEFDEKPHVYYINGSSDGVISVTTFIHEFFPKFDADLIIDKMMNSSRWTDSKYYGMTKEEIIQEWEDNKNLAAHKGTIMHRDIELYWNGLEVKNKSKEFNYFLKFYEDYSYLKPYRTEWEVYDEDLLLAGSIDMLFEDDGELIIYDWKRSRDIKEDNRWDSGLYPVSHLPHSNFWHYSLQLNLYKAILEKNYGKKVKEMYLLWLHPNNESYIRLKVPNLQNEVKDLFKERLKQLDKCVINE